MMNFQSLFLNALVDRIGMTLVHFLWQGAAITIVLAVVLRILRHRSPQSRYLAAWAALVAMTVCLPITAYFLPTAPRADIVEKNTLLAKDLPPRSPFNSDIETTETVLPDSGLDTKTHKKSELESAELPSRASVVSLKVTEADSSNNLPRENPPAKAEWSIASLLGLIQPALPWIVGVWLFGAMTLAIWHLGGFRHLVRLKRRGTDPAPAEIEQLLHRLSIRLGIRHSVSVLVSQMARVPTVLGWLRPVILLPVGILGEMSPEQLEMILAHELAHIRRMDYLWNLLQIAIETVLFYHPAIWWVSRRIREERENCCDHSAVAAMGNPLTYAKALMRLAEIRCQLEEARVPACSIAADGGSLESRIRRILGLPDGAAGSSNAWLGGILAVLLLIAIFSVGIAWAGGQRSKEEAKASADPSNKNKLDVEKLLPKPAPTPLSMTAEAFGKLSVAEQREVLVKAFQQRLDLSKNISYETTYFIRSYENKDGKIGELLKKPAVFGRKCCYWRLGDSYKLVAFGLNNPQEMKPTSCSTRGVNAEERIARNTTISEDDKYPPQGQVQYPFETCTLSSGYLFWLAGMPDLSYWRHNPNMEEHLFEYLLERKQKWEIKITTAGDQVEITVPWQPWGDKPGGNRVYQLDPQKGFLPVRCEGRFVDPPMPENRASSWQMENLVVEESREVGHVWMPVKLKETLHTSIMPEMIQITETNVVQIEAGNVKPADLVMPFTKGMQIQDIIEGVTYTADAQGNAMSPVEDNPNWKHEPPEGWRKGTVEEAYSMASRIPAEERKRLTEYREAKSKPIDEALKVLKAEPPASQEERIDAALKILRVYRVSEREADWATAIRELITIGKPAVPKLIEELDGTGSDKMLRAMGFVLRGIGDPRAIPALIRSIPRLIQPASSDYGLLIKGNPELSEFMRNHDHKFGKTETPLMPNSGEIYFSYGRPIREIMPALEKMTGQSFDWMQLNFTATKVNGAIEQRRQRVLFRDHAKKWMDWWSDHWKDYVKDKADAQLERTQKSLAEFAETIAKMSQPSLPTEIPCGPLVKIEGGSSHQQSELYMNLDVGLEIPKPKALLKKSPKDHPSPELLAWAERTGVDLIRIKIKRPGDDKTYFGYQPVGMKVWRIENTRLKNLEKELQESKKLDLPPLWEGPISSIDQKEGEINEEEPATFLFITHEGTCGTIQIRSAMHHDFVPGSPLMGSPVIEYKFIYESEQETLKEDKPAAASPHAASSKETEITASDSAPALLSVRGAVIDENGKPLAGAKVYLREWSTYRVSMDAFEKDVNDILATAQTDAQGAFQFENIPAKPLHESWLKQIPWDVVVVAKPYALAWRHLDAARQTEPLKIKMMPEAAITGLLTDKQGRPIADADVRVSAIDPLGSDAFCSAYADPEKLDLQQSCLSPAAKTNAEGKLNIGGLPRDERFLFVVKHADFRREIIFVATTKQPQPELDDFSYADGKRSTVTRKVYAETFSVSLEPPLPRLVGRITAADTKKPLAGIHISPYNSDGSTTDNDGRYVLEGIRDARVRLLVLPPKGGEYLGQVHFVDVSRDTKETPCDVELPRSEILSGTVSDAETGKGVAGVSVGIETAFDLNTTTVDGPLPSFSKTDSEGHFRLGVPPGKGKVRIFGPVRGYDLPRPSGRPDDIEGCFREVEVIAGKPTEEVKFAVNRMAPEDLPLIRQDIAGRYPITKAGKANRTIVKGKVIDPDGKPVAGADVGLWRWFRNLNEESRPVKSDQDGHFSFRVEQQDLRDEVVVATDKERKLRGHVQIPNAEQLAAAPLEIRLVPTGVVAGRVVDGDKPVVGAQITLDETKPVEGNPRASLIITNRDWAKTDDNGRFEFPLVEADKEFSLFIYLEGYTDGGCHSRVNVGQSLEMDPISLMRLDKSVAGTVVDPEGNPVAGASVSVNLRSGGSIARAFTQRPTGKDGRFVIRGVPNAPLSVMAYIRSPDNSKDNRVHFPAHVDAEPGQQDIEIILDPKLVRGKSKTNR